MHWIFWPEPIVGLVQMVLDDLAFGRTMDRLYSLILDRFRSPGPTIGPLGALPQWNQRDRRLESRTRMQLTTSLQLIVFIRTERKFKFSFCPI